MYGSGIVIAPEADPSDGLLDMIVVAGGSPWTQMWEPGGSASERLSPARGITRGRIASACDKGSPGGHVTAALRSGRDDRSEHRAQGSPGCSDSRESRENVGS
jgi:hypothetical protein